MKLIVGLGNPGKRYEKTRHNAGFVAINALRDRLAGQTEFSDWSLSKKFNAEMAGGSLYGEKIFLAKPMTFMNDSGIAVHLIADYYKIPVRDIIVVHDDKDLVLGDIKVQEDRGHAGHNGVRSIMDNLKTQTFTRVRIGVGNAKKQEKTETVDFVLGKFGIFEKKNLAAATDAAVTHITSLLKP